MQGSPGLQALLGPSSSMSGQGLPNRQTGGGREVKNRSPEARLSELQSGPCHLQLGCSQTRQVNSLGLSQVPRCETGDSNRV